MRIEYDAGRNLVYVWFAEPGTRAARTEIVSPGPHVDFGENGTVVGIEVLEARDVLGKDSPMEFAVALTA